MALQSEQPRSCASYQTLLDLCVDSYAAQVISKIENEVLSNDSYCWNRAMQLARSISKTCTFVFQISCFLFHILQADHNHIFVVINPSLSN
jgi:hypothetical protein